jgi:hypothetical protein
LSSTAPVLAAAIAAEHIDVLDRDEQLVAPGVFEPHAVVLALSDGDRLEPEVLADTVVEVDHEVAAVERRELGEERVESFRACAAERGGRRAGPAR